MASLPQVTGIAPRGVTRIGHGDLSDGDLSDGDPSDRFVLVYPIFSTQPVLSNFRARLENLIEADVSVATHCPSTSQSPAHGYLGCKVIY
ncbi:MAG: hypothetical protein N2C12_15930 [Planctomycetales bacterium]